MPRCLLLLCFRPRTGCFVRPALAFPLLAQAKPRLQRLSCARDRAEVPKYRYCRPLALEAHVLVVQLPRSQKQPAEVETCRQRPPELALADTAGSSTRNLAFFLLFLLIAAPNSIAGEKTLTLFLQSFNRLPFDSPHVSRHLPATLIC